MGEIIHFPERKNSGFATCDNASLAPMIVLDEVVQKMLFLIFSLKLFNFHWKKNWWWLKFRFNSPEHRALIRRYPSAMTLALQRIHAFSFEKAYEIFQKDADEDQSSDLFVVSEPEGWELERDVVSIFFRTYRSTGLKKQGIVLKALPENLTAAIDQEYIEYWADAGLYDQEKFRVRYFFERVQ